MPDAPAPAPQDPAAPDAQRYLVSARKYRPQTFGDLVAQEHVAETLRNALTTGRLAHAYLFSGPRGVGKTTAARLLAKAVNCQTPMAERPDAEPCRTCEACRAFEAGRSLNVIEIDAASNNRVDEMRELRETVRVPPQGAAKKVYILDEVHMLSTGAFNALLKTLEEPPPYVLFIFATTEPHKVLPTILSRTQRFDFRRIGIPEIVGSLRGICAAEGVEADEDSLVLIARKGDGALRDALSLFDQAVSLCGPSLRGPQLREALGVVDEDVLFAVTDRALASDAAGLVSLADGLVQRGYALAEFVDALAEHLRNLLVARAMGRADLVEGTAATRERYVDAAAAWSEPDLLHLLLLADRCAAELRDSRQPRLTLELGLLQMAALAQTHDLDALVRKLDRLERALAAGPLAAAGAAPPPSSSAPPSSAPPSSAPPSSAPAAPASAAASSAAPAATAEPAERYSPAEAAPSLAEAAPSSDSAPRDEAPPAETTAPPPQPDAPAPSPADRPAAAPPSPSQPDPASTAAPAPTAPSEPAPPAPEPDAPPSLGDSLFGAPALRPPAGGDGAPSAQATAADGPLVVAPADPHFGLSLTELQAAWPRLVDAMRGQSMRLYSLLTQAEPVRVARGAVEVDVVDAFTRDQLTGEAETLAQALAPLLDPVPPLRFTVAAQEARPAGAPAADPFERLKELRQTHPVIRALFDRFGAEIVWT